MAVVFAQILLIFLAILMVAVDSVMLKRIRIILVIIPMAQVLICTATSLVLI